MTSRLVLLKYIMLMCKVGGGEIPRIFDGGGEISRIFFCGEPKKKNRRKKKKKIDKTSTMRMFILLHLSTWSFIPLPRFIRYRHPPPLLIRSLVLFHPFSEIEVVERESKRENERERESDERKRKSEWQRESERERERERERDPISRITCTRRHPRISLTIHNPHNASVWRRRLWRRSDRLTWLVCIRP